MKKTRSGVSIIWPRGQIWPMESCHLAPDQTHTGPWTPQPCPFLSIPAPAATPASLGPVPRAVQIQSSQNGRHIWHHPDRAAAMLQVVAALAKLCHTQHPPQHCRSQSRHHVWYRMATVCSAAVAALSLLCHVTPIPASVLHTVGFRPAAGSGMLEKGEGKMQGSPWAQCSPHTSLTPLIQPARLHELNTSALERGRIQTILVECPESWKPFQVRQQ